MGRVRNKVVVVTGAAGGQGAAEAVALAREGATVIATDLDGAAISGRRSTAASTSRAEEAGASWATGWRAEHGRVDGLVNNAGIAFVAAGSRRSRRPTGTACSRST